MDNYKARLVNNYPCATNNVITYPMYVFNQNQNHILIKDNKYVDEDVDVDWWGQFVDIESMSLFREQPQIKKKKELSYFSAITESRKDDMYSKWYDIQTKPSSICSRAELFVDVISNLFHGLISIKNYAISTTTSIVKSPPV